MMNKGLLMIAAGVLCVAQAPMLASGDVYWTQATELPSPPSAYAPEFGDLDGDGDYDLVYGDGLLRACENTGTAQVPEWQQDDALLDGVPQYYLMTICLADLDADGDLDLSAGHHDGAYTHKLRYHENVGTQYDPEWAPYTPIYGDIGFPYFYTLPELADLDADGDLDLFVTTWQRHFSFRNIGTPQEPIWERDETLCEGLPLPFGSDGVDPSFGDLDADGDLDLVAAPRCGTPISAFENVGSPTSPAWSENNGLLSGVDRTSHCYYCELVDIDGDGDVDLLRSGPVFYLNCGQQTPVEPGSWSAIKALYR